MTELVRLGDAPQSLNTAGKGAWEHIKSTVTWLSESDLPAVYDYCRMMDELEAMNEEIAEIGLTTIGSQGQTVVNPLVPQRTALRKLIIQLQDRLELNPRAKRLAKRVEQADDTSALEGFLTALDER